MIQDQYIRLIKGSGVALVAAYLSHQFTKYVGIELLNNLYDISVDLIGNVRDDKIEVVLGDILAYEYDYDGTSFILANCKTFSKELMREVANKLKPMPDGVILVTTVQTMNDFDDSWEIIDRFKRVMSWGSATIFVQKKISIL